MCSAVSQIICLWLCFYPCQQVASTVGTFGRVLECWDRRDCAMVAIKVVRSIRKYRDAAMVEIDILQHLAKNNGGASQ